MLFPSAPGRGERRRESCGSVPVLAVHPKAPLRSGNCSLLHLGGHEENFLDLGFLLAIGSVH